MCNPTLDVPFETMGLSASSIHSHLWKIVVIDSDAAKERVGRTFVNKYQVNQPHVYDGSHFSTAKSG